MKTKLLCDILKCKHFDIDYLIELLEKYNIELDISYINEKYWKIHINDLIFETFLNIKDKFIKENEEQIKKIWVDELDCIFYIDYCASYFNFEDVRIIELFKKWWN